jgi:hypothetical protein
MQASINQTRLMRTLRPGALAAVTFVTGALLAGCGGGSGSATSAASTAAVTGAASSDAGSRSTASSAGPPAALAFARCMRSHGVPTFPDPEPGGGFAFHASPAVISSPAFKAAQSKCAGLIGGDPPGPGTRTHPSARTLNKLLTIAECMRQHGITQFPDPRTSVPSNPSGIREITDFDGAILLFPSTINMQAPAYRNDLNACGAPPLGLPH